jgi:hypothetical protein
MLNKNLLASEKYGKLSSFAYEDTRTPQCMRSRKMHAWFMGFATHQKAMIYILRPSHKTPPTTNPMLNASQLETSTKSNPHLDIMTIKYLSDPLGKLVIAYIYIHITVSFVFCTVPSWISFAARTAWVSYLGIHRVIAVAN